MAAIDFPASPANGQTFVAANGVTYVWNGTLWLATPPGVVTTSDTAPASPAANQLWFNSVLGELYVWYNDGNTTQWVPATPNMALPTTPGGDVSAVNGTAVQNNGVAQVITFAGAIVVGNAGSWLNLATGRYTPPAGRYYLSCSLSTQAPVGGNGTWTLLLRKNGTTLAGIIGSGSASFSIPLTTSQEVDANGTDYFEFFSLQQAAGMNSQGNAAFTAFPISGIKGPPGDMGALQTVSFETGAVATGTTIIPIDDTIPQITEGDQYMTLAITPRSATSKLIIDVTWHGANLAGTRNVVALFQDSTANALAASEGFAAANVITGIRFVHVMTSGTTSTTTFRVRAGPAAATTVTFNGAGAARLYGGVMASSIVIQEWP